MTTLTAPGLNFLKCAFASPDFNADPGQGIPDRYEGKVLTRKDVLTASVNFTENTDTFILVAPVPGVAYLSCEVPAGTFPTATDTFTAVPYPGFSSLFGSAASARATNVSGFRYASMNFGIYPTSNMMQFAGSITVWKAPIKLSTNQFPLATTPPTSQLIHSLVGLESAQAVGPDNFTTSFINGMYAQSASNEPDFEFSPILEGVQKMPPVNVTVAESGQPFSVTAGSETTCGITGWGDMDTIIVRVSSGTTAVNSAIIKSWACLEYRPNAQSAFYQFGHDSPPLDTVALDEYRCIIKELPVAVIAAENAHMWDRIKAMLRGGLDLASKIPGPVGMTATGISGISSMLSGLFL